MQSGGLFTDLVNRVPRGRLARGSFMTLVIKTLAMPATLAMQVSLARLLGPEPFGRFIYVFTWYTALLPLACFGVPGVVQQYVARYLESGRVRAVERLHRWAIARVAATSIPLSIAAIAGVVFAGRWVPAELHGVVAWMAVALPAGTAAGVYQMRLRAHERFLSSQLPQQLLQPVLVIVVVAVLVNGFGTRPTASVAGAGLCVGVFSSLVLARLAIGRRRPIVEREEASATETREWRQAALSFAGIGSVALLARVDVLIVGSVIGTREAGVYGAAVALALVAEFGYQSILLVISPRIAALHEAGEPGRLQQMLRLAGAASVLVWTGVAVVLIVGSEWILRLFDPSFVEGRTALVVLVVAAGVNVVTGPAPSVLTMTGRHRSALKWVLLGTTLNVVACAVLIPAYRIDGAAWALLVSNTLWKIPAAWYSSRRAGFDPSIVAWLSAKRSSAQVNP